jgi:hypothetical protein
MYMRIWLPVALGLTFLGLIALTAAHVISRGRSASPRPAATATDDEPPRLVTPHSPSGAFGTLPALLPAPTPVAAANSQAATVDAGEARAVRWSPQASERDMQLAKLRTSGPDTSSLAAKVDSLRATWETMANRSGIDVDVSPFECYRGGCFATVIHQAPQSVEELTSQILASPELAKWSGPQTRSAPIARTDGTAEVTWFLLTPTEAQPQ